MKPCGSPRPLQPSRCAFTLIELLAVMAILGLLVSMTLPVLQRVSNRGKVNQAKLEAGQLASALAEYKDAYGRFPVSRQALQTAAALDDDMTYGGVTLEGNIWIAGPGYQTNNSELMAPLLDLDSYGDGFPSINAGHASNPQRTRFLQPALAPGTNAAPGVGIDGVYRDPWGSPYVVSLDLNQDGRTRDFLYRQPGVSADPAQPGHGLRELVRSTDAQGNPVFELPGSVMVWSLGPDRLLSTTQKADAGPNRDNVLSWAR